jgi:hypothetical protein
MVMNAPLRVGRQPMIRIMLPYMYSLAEALEPLSRIAHGTTFNDNFLQLWSAQSALETLLQSSVFSGTLRSSRPLAGALLDSLKAQTSQIEKAPSDKSAWNRELQPFDTIPIIQLFSQFKIALLAEFGTFPSYFVSQKGSFDTLTLLDQPWKMFPSDLYTKVPEAMFDVAESGKSICYELPTACGFHIFRATETVLRRYYTQVTEGRPQPKVRNIAVYINAMRQRQCGDEKILSVIEQLSKLHRNPLIHPEVVLTMGEAISIVGIANSAITAMLAVLPAQAPTTTTTTTVPTSS